MDPLFATAIFVLGLCFGSFLNVCIHRLPRRIDLQDKANEVRTSLATLRAESAPQEEIAARLAEIERMEKELGGFSVVRPESACPKCHQPIKPYDNIPVVSWLLLGGKCRNCRTAISPRYIAVEVLTGLLFLTCYWKFGFSAATIKYCGFSFLIVGLTFIDAEWQLLPDVMTIPGFVAGLIASLIVPMADILAFFLSLWFPALSVYPWRVLSLVESAGGATVGAAFFYFVAITYKTMRGREGMGLGDVKLMAMVGAFLGVRLTMLTILGASLVGSVFGVATILTVWNRRTERRMAKCHEPREIARKRAWTSAKLMYRYYGIPFGVFLGPMALVSLFFGDMLFNFYWRLF